MKYTFLVISSCLFFTVACNRSSEISAAPTCYKEINLGDNLEDVQRKIVGLELVGKKEENGTLYLTLSEEVIQFEYRELFPMLFLSFNSDNKLIKLELKYSISAPSYNYEDDMKLRMEDRISETTLPCLKDKLSNRDSEKERIKIKYDEVGTATYTYIIESK